MFSIVKFQSMFVMKLDLSIAAFIFYFYWWCLMFIEVYISVLESRLLYLGLIVKFLCFL